MNLPNKLTTLRIILIPIFVAIYFLDMVTYNQYIAATIYIAACITDFLDGYIARKQNLITNFGKFMDPLADKLLVNIALICFVTTPDNPLPVWVVIIIIARDFIINGIRLVASDNGVVIAADYWGKIKTTCQMVMVVVLICNFDNYVFNIIELVLIYTSALLTVISLIDCIVKNRNVILGTPNEINSDTKKANAIVNNLINCNKTITFAESCTGGLLCSTIIEVPGASKIIKESIITYSNEAKIHSLNVEPSIIEQYTEVSNQCACQMAKGARDNTASDIAISVTGYAGPDGGNDENPVGTVYIGVCTDLICNSKRYEFKGNRNMIRKQIVTKVLDLLVEMTSDM